MGTASFMHAYMFCQHNTNELSTIIFLLLDYVAYVSYYMDFLATRFFFSLFYYFYFIYTLSHRHTDSLRHHQIHSLHVRLLLLVSNSYHHLLSESHIKTTHATTTIFFFFYATAYYLTGSVTFPKLLLGHVHRLTPVCSCPPALASLLTLPLSWLGKSHFQESWSRPRRSVEDVFRKDVEQQQSFQALPIWFANHRSTCYVARP